MATAVAAKTILTARSRVKRVRLADRLATGVITLGGLFIIVAVSFIFVFILAEAMPLFRAARGAALAPLSLPAPPLGLGGGEPSRTLTSGIDEYQRYAYEVTSDGRILLRSLSTGVLGRQFALTAAAGTPLTAAFRTTLHDIVAAGTADGRVLVQQVTFRPKFEGDKLADLDVDVLERTPFAVDPEGRRAVRLVAYREDDGAALVAASVAPDELVVMRSTDGGTPERFPLRAGHGDETITHVALGNGSTVFAATDRGDVYHWDASFEPRLIEVRKVSNEPVTTLGFALGEVSLLVGDRSGAVSAWISVRRSDDDADPSLARSHEYPGQGAAIVAIAPSPRDKSFATAAADGSVVLRHLTSERTLFKFAGDGKPATELLISPKMDGIYAWRGDATLSRFTIDSPHPDVSWRALLGKVWYEGYGKPEYVWQSTGGTDDFETKLSLVPLIFGTIKGTLYAMLFAVPIAILGALYTSQFMHPSVRSKVKPTVEIMAALPSVVIGFLAGLWLASRVERALVPVLLMIVLLPAFGTAGFLLWGRLPQSVLRRIKPGMEIALILPLLLIGAFVALKVGPTV